MAAPAAPYLLHFAMDSVLLAVSLGCRVSNPQQSPLLVQRLANLCSRHPLVGVALNCFDGASDSLTAQAGVALRGPCRSLYLTSTPGMKANFWKAALPENRTAGYDFVWLVDADMQLDAESFSLPRLLAEMRASRAALAQPRIASGGPGMRSTDYARAQATSKWPSNCSATECDVVEVQAPLFRRDAWSIVHRELLSVMPASLLLATVWGIDYIWCALLDRRVVRERAGDPTCAVLHESLAHLDTHLIEEVYGVAFDRSKPSSWKASRYTRYSGAFKFMQRQFAHEYNRVSYKPQGGTGVNYRPTGLEKCLAPAPAPGAVAAPAPALSSTPRALAATAAPDAAAAAPALPAPSSTASSAAATAAAANAVVAAAAGGEPTAKSALATAFAEHGFKHGAAAGRGGGGRGRKRGGRGKGRKGRKGRKASWLWGLGGRAAFGRPRMRPRWAQHAGAGHRGRTADGGKRWTWKELKLIG